MPQMGGYSRVLMAGPEGAGKTAAIYSIASGISSGKQDVPFTVSILDRNQRLSGFVKVFDGLLLVVDSTDRQRFAEAKQCLFSILLRHDMEEVPVVVLANKQDKRDAVNANELARILSLNQLDGHDWHVQPICAITDEGVAEAVAQMATMIENSKRIQQRMYWR